MTKLAPRMDAFLTRHFSRPSISYRQSIMIILPLIAEQLFTSLFGLLNTGMISSSGVTSLSAVSLVDTLNTFLFALYTGIATGASVIVANYRGKNDEQKLHEASVQAVSCVTLFTLMTTLFVLIFHVPLLKLLFGAAEKEVMDKARLYMLGGALTLPIVGITTSICGVLRGIGEGKTALGYTMFSTALYVLLNVLFLTVLKMGIPGLILSITLSRLCSIPILLLRMRKAHSHFHFRIKEFFRLDFSLLRSIIKVGLPCSAETLFFQGGRLITQSIIVPMGTNAIASYNIAYSILLLTESLSAPVNTGMFTICGICIGHNRPEDVRALAKSYLGFNTFTYILVIAPTLLLFPVLVRFYNAPAEIVPLLYKCIVIASIFHPIIHSFGFTLPNVFRAVGDGTYCTIASLGVMWVVRVLGGYVLGTLFGMGVMGIWIAMVLDWFARGGIFLMRFKGQKWLQHKVID